MCVHFSTLIIWELNLKFQTSFEALNFMLFSPSPSIHLLLPSSSYPRLPMVVSFFYTHLLLKMASPIIFLLLHSAAIKLQEVKDSIDEEDSRPTSSTCSYIILSILFLLLLFLLLLFLSLLYYIIFGVRRVLD